jgi:hypothetical protein
MNKIKIIFDNIDNELRYGILNKIYTVIRYEIWNFFTNIWRFRKELWNHAWWDYHFTLQMLYRSLSIMEKGMHNGIEVRESRDKKIQKMQRVLKLLDNKIEDKYTDIAEIELDRKLIIHPFIFEKIDSDGEPKYKLVDNETPEEKENNKLIYDKAREIEESQWNEIWEILKGQPHHEYLDYIQEKSLNEKDKNWNIWFDGSGLRGWWD